MEMGSDYLESQQQLQSAEQERNQSERKAHRQSIVGLLGIKSFG